VRIICAVGVRVLLCLIEDIHGLFFFYLGVVYVAMGRSNHRFKSGLFANLETRVREKKASRSCWWGRRLAKDVVRIRSEAMGNAVHLMSEKALSL
jgi:hypothetical protein